jgi:transposase
MLGGEEVPPMRALELPWPVEELERRYRAARSPLAARRYQALWLRKRGLGVAATAEAVGISAETLRQWIRGALAGGLDRLAARKPGTGGRPKLTAAQREQVLAWADASPRATMATLRRRIAAEWGVAISETQVWALVRGRGFRRVVPRKRHYQADPAALAAAEKN